MKTFALSASASALLLCAAGTAVGQDSAAAPLRGVDPKGISATVRPGDDFYRYVNEGWLRTAKPPEGVPFIDSLVEVYLTTEQRVAANIAAAARGEHERGTPEQMIGDYYRSHADMERRNALGLEPSPAPSRRSARS